MNRDIVAREFPPNATDVLYLNTGSCGRKPWSVVRAMNEGLKRLNENPTLLTFIEPEPKADARAYVARLFDVPQEQLILTHSTTDGLQLIMQSFLLKPGDELVTTEHEHGALQTIARFLEETRGITVRRLKNDPSQGSEQFALGLIGLLSQRTKLVAVSEIDCFTGWRPELSYLIDGLSLLDVPLLIDGAHSPGNGVCRPSRYPMWVASGHKWLGAPNGTGFVYVSKEYARNLSPSAIGHKYYEVKEADEEDLRRFECLATDDPVRYLGITAACELQLELDPAVIGNRQRQLMQYLREKVSALNPNFRTPDPATCSEKEQSGMLAFYFDEGRLTVPDLLDALWQKFRIWVQPDFIGTTPGAGVRISCHYSISTSDIDRFVEALSTFLK